MTKTRATHAVLILGFCISTRALAQPSCAEWSSGEFPHPGPGGDVAVLAAFDDGTGPSLVAAGRFSAAGAWRAENTARFDGRAWSPLGRGLERSGGRATVAALAQYGRDLYAGGCLTSTDDPAARDVARWNGKRWSAVGPPGAGPLGVTSLAVFDDGTGPALYASGTDRVHALPILMRWDGREWTSIAEPRGGPISALAVFDDGTGPALHAGGGFTSIGGVDARHIARSDHGTWRPLGNGIDGAVFALAVHDDGGGPALFAGGAFPASGHVVRWTGSEFRNLGGGVDGVVVSLASARLGPRSRALVAGGYFGVANGAPARSIASWDGREWSPLGGGIYQPVSCIAAVDLGSGPTLFAGTEFRVPPPPPFSEEPRSLPIQRLDGERWRPVGPGFDAAPVAVVSFDDGTGPSLFLAGRFTQAGGVAASGIVRFDGRFFAPLGTGLDGPGSEARALAVFDDGGGSALYVCGRFDSAGGVAARNVARWDGERFAPLSSGFDLPCSSLAVFDDGTGPKLYAGGDFTSAGGVAAGHVACWDGAAWSAVGGGTNGRVRALAAAGDGSAPVLVAAGGFRRAGGTPAPRIAKWDGASWSSFSSPPDGDVFVVAGFDDGSGPRVVAGGTFETIGGVAAPGIAAWDGAAWSPMGRGGAAGDRIVVALHAADFGVGPTLLASGSLWKGPFDFSSAVAAWTGTRWSRLGSTASCLALGMATLDAGGGPVLYVAGACGPSGISYGLARLDESDAAARRGNVNARGAEPADVLFVNGSAGSPGCRRVVTSAFVPARIEIALPPAGGSGDYALWCLDGGADPRSAWDGRFPDRSGNPVPLGRYCRALPIENLFTTGFTPCPITFPAGIATRPASAARAGALCLLPGRAAGRAPNAFALAFPRGLFTICGVIADPASPNARPVSLVNAVIVDSR